MHKKAKPTLQDVANLSGVSAATVSRIVNDLDGYSEETRLKVMEAIRDLGYKPNAIARGLVNRKTKTIGVLLPCVTDKFATLLLQGIEHAAHVKGYSVIVCGTESNGQRTLEYLRVLAEKQVDGIIFTSEWLTDEYGDELNSMKIPVVLVATSSLKYIFPYVKVDDKFAAYHAVKYLIEKGHRHIGMLSGPREDPIAGLPRIEGWQQALRDFQLPSAEHQIAYGDFHFHRAIQAIDTLWAGFPEMTAVFAASDDMAMGILSYAYQHQIRIPEKLSVIGYDDTETAEMAIPPLTSVRQPIYEMGQKAAEMILNPGDSGNDSIIMPFSITERDSVRQL